ncbi:hypothetical protein K1X12_06825 [Hyphomonas sp. WL0036]|uniref:hypothetical protein n=1 Tax=Hyphomonas sediminis TaxID=2866160 RepID=UPI001C7EEFF0|nr:hypothetical protein [Hyphomonas sediminis]MBY9066606.1 hypothetical protein [Hyphomonas sediminis]
MEKLTFDLDSFVNRLRHALAELTAHASDFVDGLTLAEKSLMGGMGVLMLFYLFAPGGRGEAAGTSSSRQFLGLLMLFLAAGATGGLMMAGRISF